MKKENSVFITKKILFIIFGCIILSNCVKNTKTNMFKYKKGYIELNRYEQPKGENILDTIGSYDYKKNKNLKNQDNIEKKIKYILDQYITKNNLKSPNKKQFIDKCTEDLDKELKIIKKYNNKFNYNIKNKNFLIAGFIFHNNFYLRNYSYNLLNIFFNMIHAYYNDHRISPHISLYKKLNTSNHFKLDQVRKYKLSILYNIIDEYENDINSTISKALTLNKHNNIVYLKDMLKKENLKKLLIKIFFKQRFELFENIYRDLKNEYKITDDKFIEFIIKKLLITQKINIKTFTYLEKYHIEALKNYPYKHKNFLFISLDQKKLNTYKYILKKKIYDLSYRDKNNENVFHYLSKYNFIEEFYDLMDHADATLEILTTKSHHKEIVPILDIFNKWKNDKTHYRIIVMLLTKFKFNVNDNLSNDCPFIFYIAETKNLSLFKYIHKNFPLTIKGITNHQNIPFLTILYRLNANNIINYLHKCDLKKGAKNQETIEYSDEKYEGDHESTILPVCDDADDISDNKNTDILLELDNNNNTAIVSITDKLSLKKFIEQIDPNEYVFENELPLLHYIISEIQIYKRMKYIYFDIFINILKSIPYNLDKYDLNKKSNQKHETILHCLAKTRIRLRFLRKIANTLIKNNKISNEFKKIDLYALDSDRLTCMEIAIDNKNYLLIQLFVFLGYDLNYVNDNTGFNVLHRLIININFSHLLIFIPTNVKMIRKVIRFKQILYFILDRHQAYHTLLVKDNENKTPFEILKQIKKDFNISFIIPGNIEKILDPKLPLTYYITLDMFNYRLFKRVSLLRVPYPENFKTIDIIIEIIGHYIIIPYLLLYIFLVATIFVICEIILIYF